LFQLKYSETVRRGAMRRRNTSYWQGDSWGGYAEIYPKYKIVCETENHIGYINYFPKLQYRNSQGFAEIDAELFRLCKNRISYIQEIENSGITKYVYKRPEGIKPESDMGWGSVLKIKAGRNLGVYLFVRPMGRDFTELFEVFLKKYFMNSDARAGLFITGAGMEIGEGVGQNLQKKKHHSRYNLPHQAANASPIEKLFREELLRRGIEFEEQVEFILDDKKFSVPDFVVRSANLLIYCDGTEFHNSPDRIIMDKQQDRALQANGFTVFRFSGSEIAANVGKCVGEVEAFTKKR